METIDSLTDVHPPEQISATMTALNIASASGDQISEGYSYLRDHYASILMDVSVFVRAGEIPEYILRPRAVVLYKEILFGAQFDADLATTCMLTNISRYVSLATNSREDAAIVLHTEHPDRCPYLDLAVIEYALEHSANIAEEAEADMYANGFVLPLSYVVRTGFSHLLEKPYVTVDGSQVIIQPRFFMSRGGGNS